MYRLPLRASTSHSTIMRTSSNSLICFLFSHIDLEVAIPYIVGLLRKIFRSRSKYMLSSQGEWHSHRLISAEDPIRNTFHRCPSSVTMVAWLWNTLRKHVKVGPLKIIVRMRESLGGMPWEMSACPFHSRACPVIHSSRHFEHLARQRYS